MKGKALLISAFCLLLVLMGSVAAAEVNDSYTDNLNLVQDTESVNGVSMEKLEVSSNNSISETNSHDDNLNPNVDVQPSNYEDNKNFDVNSVADNGNTYLVVDNITLYKSNGTQLKATLFDSNNTPLAGQDIYFFINQAKYTRVTDGNGSAYMDINLAPGVYSITTLFNGTDEYNKTSANSTITVLSTIISSNLIKYFRNDSQYIVEILGDNGTPAKDMAVSFNINGVIYNRVTNENGTAQLGIYLNPGKYIITVTTGRNDRKSNNITVLSVINGEDVVKYYRNGTHYYVHLLNGTGEPWVNATVTFNINGVFYKRDTNENGTAQLGIYLNPGKYIITAISPNGQYTSNNITVLSTIISNDLTKYYLDPRTFDVTIINDTGAPVAGANVTFNINGVFYKKTTNENGIASLNIKLAPNYYIITTYYGEQAKSNNIQVLAANPVITASNTQGFAHSESVKVPVQLSYPTGDPIANRTIVATINGKSYNADTNSNGTAIFEFNDLPIGEHTLNCKFVGYGGLSPAEGSCIVKIVNSTSLFEAQDLHMVFNDGSKFVVTLMDINETALANKTVTFVINGVTYNKTTDENGSAVMNIKLNPGNYTVTYKYSTPDKEDYAFGSNTVYVSKCPANIEITGDKINYGDVANIIVKGTTLNGTPVANIGVEITLNGNKQTIVLNENGTYNLAINNLPVGIYNASAVVDDMFYASQVASCNVIVNGYKLTGQDLTISKDVSSPFDVLVTDANGKAVSSLLVEFTVLDTKYNATTDGNGIASIMLPPLSEDTIVSYCCADNKIFNGQNTISVFGKIPLSNIIEGAQALKNYIENNLVVPETVNIAGVTYTTAQFLYLLSKATISISNGATDDIQLIGVENPLKASSSTVGGNLYDYKSLAENLVKYMELNGIAPDSMTTAIGESGFYPIVYALARTVAFYRNNGILPSYVSLKSVSNVIPSSPLDDKNTITDLEPYLQATKNCQVNDPAIQELAHQLTDGITNEWAKAQAIYNYVRDKVSYSFYYNTRYGATGTLTRKTGNCCDQAQLVVALFRAADLPARFVHGTCRFTSGSTYGHVWAQVLIGDTWVVADPTSTRNSLGNVVNWNNYAYTLHGKYRELPF